MNTFLSRFAVLTVAAAMIVPTAAFAKDDIRSTRMNNPVTIEKSEAKDVRQHDEHERNRRLVKVNGTVAAISTSSITVKVSSTISYTFAITSKTRMLRKHKGATNVSEIAVNDRVRVWADKKVGGTAKMILDKSIWWVNFPGTISNIDTTAKTFTLTIRWKMFDVTSTVKWDASTAIRQGDAIKTVPDLANGQKVQVKGSWNEVGRYILARRITIK